MAETMSCTFRDRAAWIISKDKLLGRGGRRLCVNKCTQTLATYVLWAESGERSSGHVGATISATMEAQNEIEEANGQQWLNSGEATTSRREYP